MEHTTNKIQWKITEVKLNEPVQYLDGWSLKQYGVLYVTGGFWDILKQCLINSN